MAVKRNRWLIGGILILAVGALVAISFLPLLSSRVAPRQAANTPNNSAANGVDQKAELEGLAKGYELVLEREPNNQTALLELVNTRVALRDLEGAIEPLEKLAELNPNEPRFSVLLAQAKQETGDPEAAAQIYRSVLTQTPGNMQALQGLVALLNSQERPQAAIGLLQDTLKTASQANEIQPGSIDTVSVRLLLGQVNADQARIDDAIATYDAAIKDVETLQQTNPDFRPMLAKALVLREAGRESEAKPLFESALAMADPQFKDRIQQLMDAGASAETPDTSEAVDPIPTEEGLGAEELPAPSESSPEAPATPAE